MNRYGVILSGPISKDPRYRLLFARGANWARGRWPGRLIWNPALLPPDRDYRHYMRRCVDVVLAAPADAVLVRLPGWRESAGALAEVALAVSIGLEVIDFEVWGDAT